MQHSCSAPINTVKAGPANYLKILGSGVSYSDDSFPTLKNEMIYWPSNPRQDDLSMSNM